MIASDWRRVDIPSNNEFVTQYHAWIHGKVSTHWKNNKERIPDAVQDVRLRLLKKDFIGRWFFKHLCEELVDRTQAEYVLGGIQLKFISNIKPTHGNRSDPDSLWKVQDLLDYAKFDRFRYYYSIQDHTIDSDTVLRLLGHDKYTILNLNGEIIGYKPQAYNALKSLYMQGKLKPAELTQHDCLNTDNINEPKEDGSCCIDGCYKKHFSRGYCTTHYGQFIVNDCPMCEVGRQSLTDRGVSLADDWSKNCKEASKLRWNDTQLKPFLRQWKRKNCICAVPKYIIRSAYDMSKHQGIDAGLLRYVQTIIDHEIVNKFKEYSKSNFTENMLSIVPPSSEERDADVYSKISKECYKYDSISGISAAIDLDCLIERACLSDEEFNIIKCVDLQEMTIKEYADGVHKSSIYVKKVRNGALFKLRNSNVSSVTMSKIVQHSCDEHTCIPSDVFSDIKHGPCVKARRDILIKLVDLGFSDMEISKCTGFDVDRVNVIVGNAVGY